VFRLSLSEASQHGVSSYATPELERVNRVLWEMWPPASQDLPWYTIDQWAINKDRHYLYEDNIHFTGPLAQAMLHQVSNLFRTASRTAALASVCCVFRCLHMDTRPLSMGCIIRNVRCVSGTERAVSRRRHHHLGAPWRGAQPDLNAR
jgi:hypothetical protein